MVLVQVTATAKVGGSEFERVLREVIEDARRSPGCLRYDWFRSPDYDRQVFVYAEFESEEAFARYRQGPVVKKIGAELLPLLEARPAFKHFRATILEEG
jgi:quinol monooxygenase YgiN